MADHRSFRFFLMSLFVFLKNKKALEVRLKMLMLAKLNLHH